MKWIFLKKIQVESMMESFSNRTIQLEVDVEGVQSKLNQFSAQTNQQFKQQDAKAIKTWVINIHI